MNQCSVRMGLSILGKSQACSGQSREHNSSNNFSAG